MNANIYHQGLKTLAAANINTGKLPAASACVTLDNPLCGDRVTIEVQLQEKKIVALGHEVKGCLLCKAAANAIGEAAIGCTAAELEAIATQLKNRLKGNQPDSTWPPPQWQTLALFEPVASHKSRHNCVLLPFTAVVQACNKVG